MKNLETITIGDNCFQTTQNVRISCPRLKEISVGEHCFCSEAPNQVVEISDCPLLETVSIKRYSFTFYEQLILAECPKLKHLSLGDQFCRYAPYFYCQDLPALEEFILGDRAFQWVRNLYLENLQSLRTIRMSLLVFEGDPNTYSSNSIHLINLTSLTRLDATKWHFMHMREAVLKNIPALTMDGITFMDVPGLFSSITAENADSLGLFFRIHRNAARMQDAFNVEFNSQIEHIPQDVTCLHLCCGTWDLHFFDFSIYQCLESLAIGAGSCSKVRSFCLQEMPHLQILSIGSYSFSEAGSPINRIFSIHDCPCLEQVTIGNMCFQQYSSFSVSNVPNLLMFNIGAFSFIHTSTFAMRDLPSLLSLVIHECAFRDCCDALFENFAALHTLSLDWYVFHGYSKGKWVSDTDPQPFEEQLKIVSNSKLILRNFPSLQVFKGYGHNFQLFRVVEFTGLPQLHYFSYQFSSFACTSIVNTDNMEIEEYIMRN